jgi:hypothetical protein
MIMLSPLAPYTSGVIVITELALIHFERHAMLVTWGLIALYFATLRIVGFQVPRFTHRDAVKGLGGA